MFRIIDLTPNDERLIEQVAKMLLDGFREMAPNAWKNLEEAREEVHESFDPERISRVAIDDNGDVVGWIGGIPQYDGNVWELHPLVVRPDMQGKGIGRALVEDLEAQVKARGGLTITLGSDDEQGFTSLYGIDLFPNPLEHLLNIRNIRNHPYEFYQKCGFVLTGIVPDANGFGKPDIIMSKRVR
ncbi:MAG TPA: GNAT family N-acetyltransferase [Oceanobacillus sp.]|nr:GNAT family N-acetyltransferase [Oceanobacillus sp.]